MELYTSVWQIGGGMGLDLGKVRMKMLVEAFGGHVTSKVSGKPAIYLLHIQIQAVCANH